MIDSATGFPRHSEDALWSETNSVLHPLVDDLMAIAARLKDAADGAETEDKPGYHRAVRRASGNTNHIALARKTYALRRKRAAIFGNPDLFGEPAWDILLDLFIAAGENKSVSVSSACIGSAAPATTGLRWLGVLADEGLIARENDPEDNRRVLVRLTPSGHAAMERFFEAVETAL
jgi:hypothetical protein